MNALTVDAGAAATQRDAEQPFEWHSLTAPRGSRAVRVRWEGPVQGTPRMLRLDDTQDDDTAGADFWSRLTHIDLESRMSRSGTTSTAALRPLAVVSHIEETDVEARALLTSAVKRLAPTLHAIIASKAARAAFPIEQAYFDVDDDDDDESRQLVVVVRARANAPQTLAFWSSLDYELDHWLVELNPADQEIVTNRLGLRFVWDGTSGS
jgi:hypothetical protein